jgi:hypothetical protein
MQPPRRQRRDLCNSTAICLCNRLFACFVSVCVCVSSHSRARTRTLLPSAVIVFPSLFVDCLSMACAGAMTTRFLHLHPLSHLDWQSNAIRITTATRRACTRVHSLVQHRSRRHDKQRVWVSERERESNLLRIACSPLRSSATIAQCM